MKAENLLQDSDTEFICEEPQADVYDTDTEKNLDHQVLVPERDIQNNQCQVMSNLQKESSKKNKQFKMGSKTKISGSPKMCM